QTASVVFVQLWGTNYARSRLQTFVGKARRGFSTVSPRREGSRRGGCLLAQFADGPQVQLHSGVLCKNGLGFGFVNGLLVPGEIEVDDFCIFHGNTSFVSSPILPGKSRFPFTFPKNF